jgi:hypothetical protein
MKVKSDVKEDLNRELLEIVAESPIMLNSPFIPPN